MKKPKIQVTQIERHRIRLAPYNPRKIAPDALARLRAGIKRFGMVENPVWNRRTGNLVAGHQRLKLLDEANGGKKYSLPVSVVALSPSEEKKLNLLLNNPKAQGSWDDEKLSAIIAELGADLEGSGFDPKDFLDASKQADIPETWQVLIDCAGEAEQVKLLKRFAKEGLKCRALIS